MSDVSVYDDEHGGSRFGDLPYDELLDENGNPLEPVDLDAARAD